MFRILEIYCISNILLLLITTCDFYLSENFGNFHYLKMQPYPCSEKNVSRFLSGTLFAQKSVGAPGPAVSAAASASPAGTSTSFGFSAPMAQTLSPTSSSSSKGPGSAEPTPSGSP